LSFGTASVSFTTYHSVGLVFSLRPWCPPTSLAPVYLDDRYVIFSPLYALAPCRRFRFRPDISGFFPNYQSRASFVPSVGFIRAARDTKTACRPAFCLFTGLGTLCRRFYSFPCTPIASWSSRASDTPFFLIEMFPFINSDLWLWAPFGLVLLRGLEAGRPSFHACEWVSGLSASPAGETKPFSFLPLLLTSGFQVTSSAGFRDPCFNTVARLWTEVSSPFLYQTFFFFTCFAGRLSYLVTFSFLTTDDRPCII